MSLVSGALKPFQNTKWALGNFVVRGPLGHLGSPSPSWETAGDWVGNHCHEPIVMVNSDLKGLKVEITTSYHSLLDSSEAIPSGNWKQIPRMNESKPNISSTLPCYACIRIAFGLWGDSTIQNLDEYNPQQDTIHSREIRMSSDESPNVYHLWWFWIWSKAPNKNTIFRSSQMTWCRKQTYDMVIPPNIDHHFGLSDNISLNPLVNHHLSV